MAVTEITKILFRRGREEDRRALEGYGGLAQGEPGFTSAGTGTLGTSPTNTYIRDSNNNIRAGFLNRNDALDHTNLEDGGGDFFVGGAGGPDIFIGGTSSEKHWQRYFISLYGTKRNCTYDYNEYGNDHDGTGDPSSTEDPTIAGHADWGFINGRMQIGAPLHSGGTNDGNSDTKNHWDDQWDLVCYGPNWHADHGNKMLTGSTNPEQTYFKWDANVGKAEFITGNAVTIPVGPLSARPFWNTSSNSVSDAEKGDSAFGTARSGDIRYNTQWQTFEGFFDSTIGWGSLGGAISKDRQTYITVDGMGGNDGCPGTVGWVGAEEDHINMVISCEKIVEADTTNWSFQSGIDVRIDSTNDVTSDANGALHVDGGVNVEKRVRIQSGTNATSPDSSAALWVKAGGAAIKQDLHVGQDVVAFSTSDERMKSNVTPISGAVEKLQQIQGVEFDWKRNGPDWVDRNNPHDVGVVAQQVERVLPEAVSRRDDGMLAVDYKRLTPLLIASVNQLTKQVEQLTEQVEILQKNQ